ncbi:unnamed protein product [Dicrocoelium dendriticum]|nr:unnamed protein product [Dicrocoelium dendriticum]
MAALNALVRRFPQCVNPLACALFLCLLVNMTQTRKADKRKCVTLGFTSQLKCNSCKELRQFNLTDIENNCLECCEEEEALPTVKRYPFAELVTCS